MGTPRLAELNLVILVLASGRGERFIASGGETHKLDAPIQINLQHTTVLQATLDKALATGLQCHVERSNHAGMGDTIAAAVAATLDADGWLVLPADMPFVPSEVILAVAKGLEGLDGLEGADICVPEYQGERGHPVGFSKACMNDLLNLSGDAGARLLFQKFAVKKVNIDDIAFAEGCLIDIDTVADLERIQLKR